MSIILTSIIRMIPRFSLWGLLLLLPNFSISQGYETKRLIQITISNPREVSKLGEMGLDVWEAHSDNAIAYVTDSQLNLLNKNGYSSKILFNSGDDYLRSLKHYSFGVKETSGQYHSYSEVTLELKQLVDTHPSIATSFSIGTSVEGRPLMMVKISNNPGVDNNKPRALFMGCHHAREWISVEVPFFLAKDLLDSYATNTLVQYMVNNSQIYIIPVVNPDGLYYSQLSAGPNWRLWRKNRRNNGAGIYGVDLNRNYGWQWGASGASPNPADETYKGTAAFSEPESKAIRDFASLKHISASISYHSYGELILFPWGYDYVPAQDSAALFARASSMQTLINSTGGQSYIAEQAVGLYPAAGDSDDWLYGSQTTFAYTIELRPVDSFGGGFVLPEAQIQPTWLENKPAAYYFIQKMIQISTGISNWENFQ